MGTATAVGAAAATATRVGAAGTSDVEPHCEFLGLLQQRSVDVDLTSAGYSESLGRCDCRSRRLGCLHNSRPAGLARIDRRSDEVCLNSYHYR